ncbi:hypothetical protein [Halobellus sp. GM3]|uniref:hypothetical protein n=1 Tax=Halobellus sp. GM3 TaxID=3458410 RepID=UPI00403D7AEA
MSAVGVPVQISRTQLLAIVVTIAVGGVAAGLLTNAPIAADGQPSPIGSTAESVPGATLEITAADPANVRNEAGDAGEVSGTLDGTLAVERPVDRVAFVVWGRLPNGTWSVLERDSVESVPPGTISVGDAVGGPGTTYLGAELSDGFDVDVPGSTARREGFVSVTARLYVDGERVATVTDTDGYAFLVDRPAERTTVAGDGGVASGASATDVETGDDTGWGIAGASTAGSAGSTAGPDESSDGDTSPQNGADGSLDGPGEDDARSETDTGGDEDAQADRTTALFGTGNAVPGSSDSSSARLANPADDAVTAQFAVGAPLDRENGLTEPESDVDDTPDVGELSDNLDVRITLEREDGERVALVGGDGAYVPLADAAGSTRSVDLDPDEAVTVIVEWRIDGDVGNEIQSDSTTLSVHATFESSSELSLSAVLR